MKPTFFQFGKKVMFLELVKYPAYGLNISLSQIFGVD